MTATRILIVDDALQVREELRKLLPLKGGIEVAGEAANGLEAIYQAQSLQPDVVLMDLEMPVMDGYEATRRIKALYPDCRVVALSLHGYAAARESAFQAGVDFFIEKGAPLDSLVQAIICVKE
jgi:two-component system, NarL family, invasion response regulator UvrY